MQSLAIKGQGDDSVIPAQRTLRVRFKKLPSKAQVRVYKTAWNCKYKRSTRTKRPPNWYSIQK